MTTALKPGAVFDCMVYLQATASTGGPAASCLRLLEAGAITVFVSEAILNEVRDVLSRPRVRRKASQMTDERVDALLQNLAASTTLIQDVPQHFTYPRDPQGRALR